MPQPRLNLLVVRSLDIESAMEFYAELGLVFTKHSHGKGPEHYASESDGMVFEIYPQGELDTPTREVRFGFEVFDVEQLVIKLVSKGAKLVSSPKDSPWGKRAVICDPVGHRIELLEKSIRP